MAEMQSMESAARSFSPSGALCRRITVTPSAREVKAVRVRAALVAGGFDLCAAGLRCEAAGGGKQLSAQTAASVCGQHGKFHDLGHAGGVVQLLLQPQVEHAGQPVRRCAHQTAAARVGELPRIDRGKTVIGERAALQRADEPPDPGAVVRAGGADGKATVRRSHVTAWCSRAG